MKLELGYLENYLVRLEKQGSDINEERKFVKKLPQQSYMKVKIYVFTRSSK